jgi:8-oxo-dGTP pyrophosphatase MutT (NUDIX family)
MKACDYEVLMLKRNPKISFGNYYAFPGGMLERQDQIQPWRENLGEWFKSVGVHYPDFSKRVCALRELYEETNLMFSRRTGIGADICSLENYSHKYKNDFV